MSARSVLAKLLSSVDTVLFDCDGVLWRGSEVIAGAGETVAALRRHGKTVYFLTNNATRTRAQIAESMKRMGIPVVEHEVLSSAYAAALYLRGRAFSKAVYVVGQEGLHAELNAQGLRTVGRHDDQHANESPDTVAEQELDDGVGAVVIGFDSRFNYYKLCAASGYLLRDRGVQLIATNTDNTYPHGQRLLAGGGCMSAAVAWAAGLPGPDIVIGKPERHMLDVLEMVDTRLVRERTLMVGDRVSTDIRFGQAHGLRTLLVLSGVTDAREAAATQPPPDAVADSVADLLPVIEGSSSSAAASSAS